MFDFRLFHLLMSLVEALNLRDIDQRESPFLTL